MAEQEAEHTTPDATQDGATAGDTPNTEQAAAIYTQADFDRKVSESAVKMQKNQEAKQAERDAELEKQRLEEAGEHEKLAAQYKAEAETERAKRAKTEYENTARKMLGEMGLGAHAETLIVGTDSIDVLADKAASFKDAIAVAVTAGIEQAKHTGTGIIPKQNTQTTDKTPDKMSVEEFQKFKEKHGVIGRV